MSITLKIVPHDIGGKKYLTVTQMAMLTNKSEQTIYNLILRGNAVRKMRCYKVVGRTLIPMSELTEFPFTFAGPDARNNVYHYDERGNMVVPSGGDKK